MLTVALNALMTLLASLVSFLYYGEAKIGLCVVWALIAVLNGASTYYSYGTYKLRGY